MKLGILQTGRAPEEVAKLHGDYDDLFKQLLAGRGFNFVTYRVLDDVFPCSVDECDGWIITGSRFGVYEDHPWIPPLEDFIRQSYQAGVPMVGVCFGHQIIAQALGGKVEKFSGGWSCGAVTYAAVESDQASCEPAQMSQTLMAWHQDQVVSLPPAAEVIGRSDFCPYAMLAYGDKALSIQPHPEFSTAFFRDLFEQYSDIFPDEIARRASASLDEALDTKITADSFESFFKRSRS
jgi:GMP synthase-like glutamine amidotransferase